ncbi:MAG TPA: ABC transporter ATP-binding protein [Candidatus Spyradocola merdavium]|nr:ABC transporter ATP-binding protein [Candidatus Spyradocola merdavium]
MQEMLQAKGVSRAFPAPGGGEFWALRGIDLSAPAGKLTILKGRSGSGKTTLLNILSALDPPTAGEVILDGREITALSDRERTALRRTQVGYVFQSVALIPMMTALENVEFALRLTRWPARARRDRALECLKLVGLAQRAGHLPQELSGGEQQRVAVARAFAHRPKVLFADEPTGALDTNTGLQVVKIFRDLCTQEGVTVVMTTHDPNLMEIGDAVYELEDGELVHG